MTATSTNARQRRSFTVGGQVQGVGFRPFVYRLAVEHGLSGSVGNTSDGVRIEVQGSLAAVEAFAHDLQHRLPPLARVVSCVVEILSVQDGEDSFSIVASHGHSGHSVLISPDVALCQDCQTDMADPRNRRHGYPFTNCTNCGPRYTITRAIPYDRAVTSMACFPLCPQCQAEYDNPLDRRFHAQPNACPVCGPQVWVEEDFLGAGKGELFVKSSPLPLSQTPSPSPTKTFINGSAQGVVGNGEAGRLQGGDALNAEEVAASGVGKRLEGIDALKHVAQCLRNGQVAAIKGLGGFHLACDATNASVVALLRERKARPHKALAVMVPDMATARQWAHVGEAEEKLLCSPQRPIVLCRKRAGSLPDNIAPDVNSVGLVLPYTPLHLTLLECYRALVPADAPAAPAALVMTSGNAGGEPICLGNREALRRLKRIADVFLLHNRDILVRNDDSVVGLVGSPLLYRRARGYVPSPVALGGAEQGPCVLGVGPELKATLCLTRGNAAFVSQHVGDVQNMETLAFYEEVAAHLEMLLESRPEAVVHDLHPDFLSTAFAQELAAARGVPCWGVQHHVAHAWAVLAEHGYAGGDKGAALALVLDGTGLGEDGTIWGGELLWVDTAQAAHTRLGRLRPFALPGGEAAIREPWRIAVALGLERVPGVEERRVRAVQEMLQSRVNCPLTSSAGRLFDAVSAALGLCLQTTYEGQAAIRLEAAQQELLRDSQWSIADKVPVERRGELWELDSRALFAATLHRAQCENVAAAARAFHVLLAQGLADMVSRAAEEARFTGTRVVALSGGAMQNATLAVLLPRLLERKGLIPLLPRDMPANDGGVSLGQAAWGRRKLLRGL